jgi:type VI protein secretion system component Hcp
MAIDSFMYFQDYQEKFLPSESQVDLTGTPANDIYKDFKAAQDNHGLFEVADYSFDIEQILSIGSQSSGAGAGKVSFNPFSITRNIDVSSPQLFQNACAGTPYMNVGLGLRKSAGGNVTGTFFLQFIFKLVAVKTISWAHDDESPKETTTFEYGGLVVRYGQQKPDGSIPAVIAKGWNRVKNISATPDMTIK